MPTNTIGNPSIDRPFVNGKGALTAYGYGVLAQLILRVGGNAGEVLDPDAVEAVGLQPAPIDNTAMVTAFADAAGLAPVQQPFISEIVDPSGEIAELRALIATMQAEIDGLKQGVQL